MFQPMALKTTVVHKQSLDQQCKMQLHTGAM